MSELQTWPMYLELRLSCYLTNLCLLSSKSKWSGCFQFCFGEFIEPSQGASFPGPLKLYSAHELENH